MSTRECRISSSTWCSRAPSLGPIPVQISSQIEGVGGVLNAGTEHELTVFWCKVAQPHFGDSLDLIFDMLRNSLYGPEDIETERHIIHEELAMILDYPTSRVDSLIDEMLWPNHPLGPGHRRDDGVDRRHNARGASGAHGTALRTVEHGGQRRR